MWLRRPNKTDDGSFHLKFERKMYLDLTNHAAVCSWFGVHRSELRLGFDRYVNASAEGGFPTTNPDF